MNNLNHKNTFQASTHIISVNVPMAKEVTCPNPSKSSSQAQYQWTEIYLVPLGEATSKLQKRWYTARGEELR